MKYLVGSTMLGLSNNRDKDYLVITDEYGDYKSVRNGEEDIICISYDTLVNRMEFKSDYKTNAYFLILNYQFDKDIIGQDFPIEYHILDYKKELIQLLKTIVEYKLLNLNKRVSIKGGLCSKWLYHIAYNVFIIQNNSTVLTSEQKETIQKIHDKEMLISFRDELIKMISKL